ncbi:MAG: molybdopterin molybdotransferase MoeA [Deltaproteobacteria bacterium]|nr:molybdopterin molybdotransferase MoeA [Deltaproteobacteria bacterium]
MLSVADATRTVLERVPRLAAEDVPLDRARGRILAAEIVAQRPLPGFNNSAMDGYAARSSELPATLKVGGVVAAGAPHAEPVPEGVAMRIFTGAPMPADLDTVVIQEDATVEGDQVTLPAAPAGDNVRNLGEDFAVGESVIPAGTRITAWHLGVLAALGVSTVTVSKGPRVALIATGDELVDIATPLGPGQLVDSSAHALVALVEELGGTAHRVGIARDDVSALADLIAAALGYDVVITTGGVSVGDRDHVRAALAAVGVELELYKVAMKPGKPFSFGLRNDERKTPVFGLPGNPVSTAVAFELFLRPALLTMQGATVVDRPRAPVQLVRGYRKQPGRAHYLRANIVRNGDHLIAHPHPKQGSAMLSSLVTYNALVELPADVTELMPGTIASAMLLEAV